MRSAIVAALGVGASVGCGGVTLTAPAPTGCPAATEIALATWAPPGVGPGAPRTGEYRVRLGVRSPADPQTPAPGPIATYEAAKLGVGPLPDRLWLMRAGLDACTPAIVGYVAESILDDDGAAAIVIAARLADCPGDTATEPGWVTLAGAPPTECRVEVPVDGEAGAVQLDDRAIAADAVPASWLDAMSARCADGCQLRWSTSSIAGPPIVDALHLEQVMDAQDPDPTRCEPSELVVAGPTRKPVALAPSVRLAGALVDRKGLRVVLAIGPSRWQASDVDGDGQVGYQRTVDIAPARADDCAP